MNSMNWNFFFPPRCLTEQIMSYHLQDRQCTHNVTLRQVCKTTAAVEKQQLSHICVCVCECVSGYGLTNPACNAPSHCHLQPLWLYNSFPHYLINFTIFGKKLLNIKCVFWFSLLLLFETILILRRIPRDIVINVKMSSRKVSITLFGL